MKEKIEKLLIFTLSGFFLYGLITASQYNLTKSQIIKLNRGSLVVKKKAVRGAPWPEVTIYSVINATPEESMAVYIAFPEHKNFIPGLLKSKPSKYITPTDIYVDFEVDLAWPLANSKFTTGNKIRKLGNGSYSVKWYPVRHSAAKDCHGEIKFIPFYNKTLFIYRNFTLPKSRLASLFKGRMIKNLKRTIKAIIHRINGMKSKTEKMERYINQLNRILSGKYIYEDIMTK